MRKRIFAAILSAVIFVLNGCGATLESSSSESDISSYILSGESLTEDSQSIGEGDETSSSSSSSNATAEPNISSLSEKGNGYEGEVGSGEINYGEALQKSLLFYELQRSGDLDENKLRTNWRGDSGLTDGADVGLDLTGGLYDAGDNVKFNLPMAYTATMLAWSVYEDKDAYEKSGQLEFALGNIKWICDYLIKCHPQDDVFYYQVGDGGVDHSWWGASEVMQMARPSYKADKNAPCSTVSGEAAAALAACAAVYKNIDGDYSKKCLSHAKQLYSFAESTKSDVGYTAANGFYGSTSGFYDELSWAAVWLNIATGERSWLDKAKTYFSQSDVNTHWTLCWDNKSIGAACLLAKITGEQFYIEKTEECLDWWCGGNTDVVKPPNNGAAGSRTANGGGVTYSPKGLAWLDSWGSLRYATTTAMLAASYSESEFCSDDKAEKYIEFCEKQINYALGSTGRSFVVGFGENPPEHPHHRTAQGSWSDNMNVPEKHRHTLYGALVGGPDSWDNYNDSVSDYVANEVACDYNAGFTGALAKMYKKYGGQTLKDFGAVENVGEEMFAEYSINAFGTDFTEIKAVVYNQSAWPARVAKDMELRYFVNLSELADPTLVNVNLNYNEGAKFGGIYEWDKANGIYFVSIDFSDALIYPGGQSAYKKEVQFRMSAEGWNSENDPSYVGLGGANGSLVRAENCALYEGGVLVFGTEPSGNFAGEIIGPAESSSSENSSSQTPQESTVNTDEIKLSLKQQPTSGNASTIALTIELSNTGSADISLTQVKLGYFFTADGKNPICECDYAGASGSVYANITAYVKSVFESVSGENRDTKCVISFSGGTLESGGTATLQLRIHTADWTNFNLENDWSAGDAQKVELSVG